MDFNSLKMIENIKSNLREIDESEIRQLAAQRSKQLFKTFDPFVHKGTRGHAAIFAGSHGMMGAAVLSTMAATRSGAGKITVIVPERYFEVIHNHIPEALLLNNLADINFSAFNAMGIGPGLGNEILTQNLIQKIVASQSKLVLDADMLNFLSQNPSLFNQIPKGSILTPHPIEWKRMFGDAENDKDRIIKTQTICLKFGFHVLIKGHVSAFITPQGEVFLNATGNAGMAKGGSGDVLTGLITGLLAQGYAALDAGVLGMYIHGLAGDLAKVQLGENAMTPSDQILQFGAAFGSLK